MTVALKAPMSGELVWANVMRPRIPLIYLDLNTIIYFAKALRGDTDVPNGYLDLYEAVMRAKSEQRAMFPLGESHLWEITKITDPSQRERLAEVFEAISDFNGLGKSNPVLVLALTVLLAALAGVPLTAGFVGKFFVFQAAVGAGLWAGVGVAFIAAAAGFYYYLNVVRAMWWVGAKDQTPVIVPGITKGCVAALTVATLVFGIWPQPILSLLG